MLEWQWPWAFLLLPLPLLMAQLSARRAAPNAALKVPELDSWHGAGEISSERSDRNWQRWLLPTLIWLSLVTALARPQVMGDTVELPRSGRDLMLAVDISGSMRADDMRWQGRPASRLAVVKAVLNDFIAERQGDRLGLILFGSQAYLQAPLTFDTQTVRTFVGEAAIGLAGQETAIGDAIGLAIKRLQNNAQDSRVLVLLTDGANSAGEVEPLRAAELAEQVGLKIYTIGLGAESGGLFSLQRTSPPDERTLRAIAQQTGGAFFRARNSEELRQIYALIDELEPTLKDTQALRPQRSLYYWPLAAAVLFGLLLTVQQSGWRLGGREP
ncbi:BatB protein [Bacterioplanes sanyensis]|uniref:BatB protein n=1 Tax=Bacterioplanes sanyensis TaxID=1249553 RepID=A0A222FKN5_9GAMM|nr:VWA domain-containing protein [Bacterioplanes sanyensis]ASP39607.1 BatB protein [Bacterioplanes sanyensis]